MQSNNFQNVCVCVCVCNVYPNCKKGYHANRMIQHAVSYQNFQGSSHLQTVHCSNLHKPLPGLRAKANQVTIACFIKGF